MPEFSGFSAEAFGFLSDLRENARKEWFHANRKRYEQALVKPFRALVEAVAPSLLELDSRFEVQPKTNRTLTRINRDIRFNRNVPPYKDHMLALFYREGRKRDDAQLFLGLQPSEVWSGLYVGTHLLGDDGPAARRAASNEGSLAKLGRESGVGSDFELCICERYGEVGRTLEGTRDQDYLTGPHLVVLRRSTPEQVVEAGPGLATELAETCRRLFPLWRCYSGEAA